MRLSKAIQEFLEDLKRRGASPNTRTGYEYHLDRVRRMMPVDLVSALTPEVIKKTGDVVQDEGKAPNTLYGRQTALKAFAKWGMEHGLWPKSPLVGVPLMRKPDALPRPLEADEWARIAALELPPKEAMARLLLVCTGLRVTEVCSIQIGNVNLETGRLRVQVKGGRTRSVEMPPVLVDALATYLATERAGAKSYETILVQVNGQKALTKSSVEKMARAWGAEAGVPGVTPHRFRHLFGTTLYEQTGDLALVQKAMGHRQVTSTQIYTRVADARVRRAISDLPWASLPPPKVDGPAPAPPPDDQPDLFVG